MNTTYKFSVAPEAGSQGRKWVARSMWAPKATEQFAWGVNGFKTHLIGVYSSKQQALEAMRAEAKRVNPRG